MEKIAKISHFWTIFSCIAESGGRGGGVNAPPSENAEEIKKICCPKKKWKFALYLCCC